MANNTIGLNSILKIFTWSKQTTLNTKILKRYYLLLESKFYQRIEFFEKAGLGRSLKISLATLSDDSKKRIINAPSTSNDLLFDDPTNLIYYNDVILAEQLLSNQAISFGNVWTAKGDFYFTGQKKNNVWGKLSLQDSENILSEKPYSAPLLDDSIVVDFVSPHAVKRLKDDSKETVILNTSEQRIIFDKLQQALNLLKEVSPHAYQFVKFYTQVIVIGKDLKNPSDFSSSSTEFYIGRMVLINYHTKQVTIDEIIDTLVHEAIHIAIYIIELKSPIIIKTIQDKVDKIQAKSAWTGNLLYLHAFFHANFVWYGLWCFWSKIKSENPNAFSEAIINQRIEAAKLGFKNGKLSDELNKVDKNLTQEAKSVIYGFVRDGEKDNLPI